VVGGGAATAVVMMAMCDERVDWMERAAVGAGRRLEGCWAQRLLLLVWVVVIPMRSQDRQRVRLVAEASCSQQCGGASERLTDAAKEGTEGRQGGSD
jgi:hypothetical protein